jgi:predicted phage gp36 major capsid-like protein
MIIGVTNGTIVKITLPTFLSINLTVSYHDNNYTNGDVFTVYLDRYQTFHCYQKNGDFTANITTIAALSEVTIL